MDSSSFWALVGVTVGFVLGEGSRLVRRWLRISKLKRLVRDELISVKMQIPQKRDILRKMTASLNRHQLLSGASVAIANTGYRQNIGELYEHLSINQRNCLHVIHERLRVADEIMNRFMDDFQAASRDKVIEDPFDAFKTILGNTETSYQTVEVLIDSYIDNKPIDVFHIKPEKPEGKKAA
jgi:hypothetical protein